jgi:flagellar basal body-associated protein FliL
VENEAAAAPTEQDVPGLPKKKGGRLWLTLVGALVIASVSSAVGATFGPSVKEKISGPKHQAAAGEEDEKEERGSEHGGHIAPLDSLVVDVRDETGESHHVKVGIALELGEPPKEEEWKMDVVPRARDATIGYLRSLKYEEAASSAKFETIRTELQEHIAKAVKKPKIRRVFFIDYVVQ